MRFHIDQKPLGGVKASPRILVTRHRIAMPEEIEPIWSMNETAVFCTDFRGAPMGSSTNVDAKRLMKLPVTVTVRLAERQVELKQMLNLSPGSLLTFDKSCDELLDLYVNNQLYGRGEAVKIGEKFGLKINKIGDTL